MDIKTPRNKNLFKKNPLYKPRSKLYKPRGNLKNKYKMRPELVALPEEVDEEFQDVLPKRKEREFKSTPIEPPKKKSFTRKRK